MNLKCAPAKSVAKETLHNNATCILIKDLSHSDTLKTKMDQEKSRELMKEQHHPRPTQDTATERKPNLHQKPKVN